MICIDVMSILCGTPLKMIGPIANRYEFQGINHFEIIEWWLHKFY